MAAESMSIEAILTAVDENFSKTMEQAVSQLSQLTQRNNSMGGSAMKTGAMMGAAAAVTSKAMGVVRDSLGGAINRFDTLNKYPVVMDALGYSERDVAKSSQTLQKGIDGLPTSLDEITSVAQQLGPLTGSANKASKSAVALNDAFLASGASVADTSRGLQQYTQMLSTGKVDMMSYRTLMETMPIALRKVANSFGFTGKSAENDLYKALQDGSITIDQLNDRFIKLDGGVNGFSNLARKNSAGIQTSFANLKNAVVKNMANMMTAINDGFAKAGFGSIAQQLDGLKNSINASFKAIAPIVTNVVTVILQVLRVLINFVNQNKDWLKPLTLGVAGFLGATAGMGKSAIVIGNIVGKFKALSGTGVFLTKLAGKFPALAKGFSLLRKSSTLLSTGMETLNGALTLASDGFSALTATIAANPIGAITVAILAVVAALTWFFTQTQTGRAIWANFVSWLVGVWQGLASFFGEIWQSILAVALPIWMGIVNVVRNAVTLIATIFQKLAAILSPIIAVVVVIVGSAFIGLVGIISTAWNMLVPIITVVWQLISSAITASLSIIKSTITTAISIIAAVWTTAWNVLVTVVSTVWSVIGTVITAGLQVIAGIFAAITNVLQGNWSGAWNQIKNIVFISLGAIGSVVSTILSGITGVFASVMGGLKGIVSAGWNGIKRLFNIGVNFIKSVVHINLFSNGKAIMDSFLRGLKSTWESIKKFVKGIAKWIGKHKGPISYDRKLLIPAGKAIMQGLNNGLIDGFGAVQSNVLGMAGQIQQAVANAQSSYANGLGNLHSTIAQSVNGTVKVATNNPQQSETNYLLRQIADKDTTMVLDNGTLVGATYGAYDQRLGQNVALSGRWS